MVLILKTSDLIDQLSWLELTDIKIKSENGGFGMAKIAGFHAIT